MSMAHRNSFENNEPHHLYEIWDKEKDDTFKYGISSKPIGADGLSARVRDQVSFLNLITGWARFIGRILLVNIAGRREARRLEEEYIRKYIDEHGKRPRGSISKVANTNEFKREQAPPVLRVSTKSFGMGRRLPIVGKYLG